MRRGLQKESDTRVGALDDLDTWAEITEISLLKTKTVLTLLHTISRVIGAHSFSPSGVQCSEEEGREEKKEEKKEGRREEEEGLQKEVDTRAGVLDDLDTSVEITKMRLL